MKEDTTWIKSLAVGDEVATENSSMWNRNNYSIAKVEKITPTGRLRLSNGKQYYADGREVGGDSYNCKLKQVTPAIIEFIRRKELISEIGDFNVLKAYLSADKLELVKQWKEEIEKEVKS